MWSRPTGHQNDSTQDIMPHDITDEVIKLQSLCISLVAKPVLWALSPKLWGRFCQFLACKLIWPHRPFMQNFITIRPIGALWENFLISMATDSNFQIPFSQLHPLAPIDCACVIWSNSVEKPERRCMQSTFMSQVFDYIELDCDVLGLLHNSVLFTIMLSNYFSL